MLQPLNTRSVGDSVDRGNSERMKRERERERERESEGEGNTERETEIKRERVCILKAQVPDVSMRPPEKERGKTERGLRV